MKKIYLLAILLIASVYLIGCTQQATTEKTPTVPTSPETKAVQKDIEKAPKSPVTKTLTPTPQIKEFNVQAFRFSFNPAVIEVKEGDKVILHLTSTDVPHGFGLPDFGINEALNPGETKTVEFIADKKGTFTFRCTIPCGSGHSGMSGKLIVQ